MNEITLSGGTANTAVPVRSAEEQAKGKLSLMEARAAVVRERDGHLRNAYLLDGRANANRAEADRKMLEGALLAQAFDVETDEEKRAALAKTMEQLFGEVAKARAVAEHLQGVANAGRVEAFKLTKRLAGFPKSTRKDRRALAKVVPTPKAKPRPLEPIANAKPARPAGGNREKTRRMRQAVGADPSIVLTWRHYARDSAHGGLARTTDNPAEVTCLDCRDRFVEPTPDAAEHGAAA